jgi:hypothetical protein
MPDRTGFIHKISDSLVVLKIFNTSGDPSIFSIAPVTLQYFQYLWRPFNIFYSSCHPSIFSIPPVISLSHMRDKRCNFNPKTNSKFTSRLKSLLITTRDQPETGTTLGIQWISDSDFVVNSKKLAEQLQITPNDLCYNFRSHGFGTESATHYRDEIKALGTPSECRLHGYPGLNKTAIETILDQIPWRKPIPIPGRRAARRPERQQIQPIQPIQPIQIPSDPNGIDDLEGFEGDLKMTLWGDDDMDPFSLLPL